MSELQLSSYKRLAEVLYLNKGFDVVYLTEDGHFFLEKKHFDSYKAKKSITGHVIRKEKVQEKVKKTSKKDK